VTIMRQYLISTRVKPRTCPRCNASTLFAYSEGVPAHVDATPIDAAEELAALAEGRWTYELLWCGELLHRDQYRICGKPYGTIHQQHRCDTTRR